MLDKTPRLTRPCLAFLFPSFFLPALHKTLTLVNILSSTCYLLDRVLWQVLTVLLCRVQGRGVNSRYLLSTIRRGRHIPAIKWF